MQVIPANWKSDDDLSLSDIYQMHWNTIDYHHLVFRMFVRKLSRGLAIKNVTLTPWQLISCLHHSCSSLRSSWDKIKLIFLSYSSALLARPMEYRSTTSITAFLPCNTCSRVISPIFWMVLQGYLEIWGRINLIVYFPQRECLLASLNTASISTVQSHALRYMRVYNKLLSYVHDDAPCRYTLVPLTTTYGNRPCTMC